MTKQQNTVQLDDYKQIKTDDATRKKENKRKTVKQKEGRKEERKERRKERRKDGSAESKKKK